MSSNYSRIKTFIDEVFCNLTEGHISARLSLKKDRQPTLSISRGTSIALSFNHAPIRTVGPFPTGLWLALLIFVLVPLVTGCASLVEKGLLPEVVVRQPPEVQVGQELILFEKPPILSTSIIDRNGAAHVFAVDENKHLNHLEILGDKIITQELLGIIETKQGEFIDTIEHPPGKLRVLAGNKQYFRVAPNREWQEIPGNRCARFVPVGDNLFGAFVIKGEEIGAPERTDYTFGCFFLVPIVYWSHEQASKLVLAQETHDGWIVRAVVDPDTPMDANGDFMVETDSLGNIHFLYFNSRGGGTFFVFAYGYSGGAGGSTPEPELRYAQVTCDQFLAHFTHAQNQVSSNNSPPGQWMAIKGSPLTHKPFINKDFNSMHANINLRPLSKHFSVNKKTGEVNGLMWASKCTLDDGERKLPFIGSENLVVEVNIRDRQWSPHFNIVAAKDFPTSDSTWSFLANLLIKADGNDADHLLLQSVKPGTWKGHSFINYLVKSADDWSAPLTLGSSQYLNGKLSLAVNDSGVAFAAWVNKEHKFIGRWIKPVNDMP